VRADVSVEPMTWSADLATYVQQWAAQLAGSSCTMKHRNPNAFGENLFQGTLGASTAVDAAKTWETETAMPCISLRPHCRGSRFDSDDVRLNLAAHRARPEAPGDGLGGDVGRFAEPRFVARLDLVAQRRPLAVGDRWHLG
jgi:hypothetical protein